MRGWSGGEGAVGSEAPLLVIRIRTWGTRSEREGTTSGLCPGKRVDNESDFRASHERRATTASSMEFHTIKIYR